MDTRASPQEVVPSRRWLLAAAWGALAIGVLLRVLAAARMDIWVDGVEYAEMGHAWSLRHEFLLPDSERMGRTLLWGPGYSHHFPPAYPFALGLVFSLIGFGALQAKIANVVISLAALAAVYATTRNLFGAERAPLVAGIVAVEPSLIWVTGVGLSENFTLLFSTLTLWAFLKSLRQSWYLLPAGIFWSVVYLARASAGVFGLLPAALGAWWWWRFRGLRALLDTWCIAAGLVFAATVLGWGWRNYQLFGDWATSAYVSEAYAYGMAHPALLTRALLGKGAFFLVLFLAYAVPFLPELRASLRRLREAEVSLLWLFVSVIWGLAWLVTSSFWPYEPRSFFSLDHHRYILLAVVPLLWLALREAPQLALVGRRWAGVALLLLVATGAVLHFPVRRSSARAAEFIDLYLRDGDVVMIGGSISKYDLDMHFSRSARISVRSKPGETRADFAFLGDLAASPLPPGWELVGSFEQRGWSPSITHVIARREIVRERGLPTGLERTYR